MKKTKYIKKSLVSLVMIIMIAFSFIGCEAGITEQNPPEVVSTSPSNGSIDADANGTITATFNVAMDPASITDSTFTVSVGGVNIAGAVTYDEPNKKAIFTPTASLSYSKEYTATLTTGVKTSSSVAMAGNKVWLFTTGADLSIPPEVLSTSPSNGSIDADTNGTITATFNVAMDPASITESTFTVSTNGTPVSGTVTYDIPNKKAIFTPSAILDNSKEYTATLTTSVKTSSSVAMAGNEVWIFTTAAEGIGPSPVLLRTAGNYVILAKSAISTVPSSVITGDVGLSPAALSYVTGFSHSLATGYATSPQVTGFLYAADMVTPTSDNLTTAVEDMLLAYSDAANRINPDQLNYNAGELGGQTLNAGLYKWTSSVTITGSDVTISGGANDIWIFQITGDLSLGNNLKVLLSGGAQAKNIVWQVAGEVVLGTGSHFEGIILCETKVTMKTGASMNGRLLSKTQVALDQATVTKPAL